MGRIVRSAPVGLLPGAVGGGRRDRAARSRWSCCPDERRRTGPARARSRRTRRILKGRYHWNKAGRPAVEEAVAFYEQAVALDPDFAAAHAVAGAQRMWLPRSTTSASRVKRSRRARMRRRPRARRSIRATRTRSSRSPRSARRMELGGAEAAYRHGAVVQSEQRGGAPPATACSWPLAVASRKRRWRPSAPATSIRCVSSSTRARRGCGTCRGNIERAIDGAGIRWTWMRGFGPARRVLAAALVEAGRKRRGAVSEFERASRGQLDAVLARVAGARAGRAAGTPRRAIEAC